MRKAALFFLALMVFLSACARYRLEKSLDPESREFLSKARYIITSQERRTFLQIPPSEREYFIEEFWKRRDPTPDTERNEYKDAYFKRIEEASRLFSDAGGKGWLEDRGRVYILLGPPENRSVYPRGVDFYGPPTEFWYYGLYQIVFIDQHWDGSYELIPQSARDIAQINVASQDLKPTISRDTIAFDFTLRVEKTGTRDAVIQVELPYKNIWFSSEEGLMKTNLTISLEVLDSSRKKVWDYLKEYPLSFAEKDIREFMEKVFSAEIPITLEPGKYTLRASLINQTDKSPVRKSLDFEL